MMCDKKEKAHLRGAGRLGTSDVERKVAAQAHSVKGDTFPEAEKHFATFAKTGSVRALERFWKFFAGGRK